MPIATPEIYAQMLDRAKQQGFAYPAINVTSSQTLNAALRGFAEAESDGIVQISTGGAEYLSGAVKDMVTGAVRWPSSPRSSRPKYPVNIALHTDHCPKDKLDGYMRPLVKISQERVATGEDPLFQSHMWDGSAVPLEENLHIASELLDECATGAHHHGDGDRRRRRRGRRRRRRDEREALHHPGGRAGGRPRRSGLGERGRYILAATFGNVHGVYKPGHVKLRPEVLKEIQDAVGAEVRPGEAVRPGVPRRLGLGAGGDPRGHLYGVVKMNVDTDTQYAFTRPVAGHMFTNYDGVLKVDGDVGNKKAYDPRSWGKAGRGGHGRPRGRTPARTCSPPARAHLTVTGSANHGHPTTAPNHGRPWNAKTCWRGPPAPTHLPTDPATELLSSGTDPAEVAARYPSSSAAWAALAERAYGQGEFVAAYAYARTGYHRGLDQLRRAGWRGNGPVPWEHEPNRGFLRCLAALGKAAAPSTRRTRPTAARTSCATPSHRRRRAALN